MHENCRKKKKERKKKAPEPVINEIVRPSNELKSDDEKTGNDFRVRTLWKALPKQRTDFFEFTINPNDFTETVENLFDLSFLVKDGLAKVDFHEELPHLIKAERPIETDKAEGLKHAQCVIKLDMQTFKDMIDINNIQTNLIPSREMLTQEKENGKTVKLEVESDDDEKKNNGKRPRKKQKR